MASEPQRFPVDPSKWVSALEDQDASSFKLQKMYQGCIGSVIVTNEQIKKRLDDLAIQITEYYQDRPYVILVVLKGAFVVFSDLYRSLMKIYEQGKYTNNVTFEFIQLSSYRNTESTGNLTIKGDTFLNLEGKEVLIVEDIVDSGLSMAKFLAFLEQKSPKSARIFTLVLKEGKTAFPFEIDYVAFLIPNKFVVGYGLDYNEAFRDLPHLCIITNEGVEKFSVKNS